MGNTSMTTTKRPSSQRRHAPVDDSPPRGPMLVLASPIRIIALYCYCCSLLLVVVGGRGALAFSSSSSSSPAWSSSSRATTTTTGWRRGGATRAKKRPATAATAAMATVAAESSSVASATGDADRAFRLGMQLERAGLARSASAAFHEAATLYQCFLDGGGGDANDDRATVTKTTNVFRHVTSLATASDASGGGGGSPTVLAVLAYCCVRLAHLSHDDFGDPRASVRLYKMAADIDPRPSGVAYHGIGTSIEASATWVEGGGGGRRNESDKIGVTTEKMAWRMEMERAAEAYGEARALGGGLGSSGEVSFHLAVALERLGEVEESEKIMETLRRGESDLSSLVDSWGYVRWHTRRTEPSRLNLHRGTRAMLQIALDAAAPLLKHDDGLVCEFGVATGRSMRMTQELLPLDVPIHGFDTFTGLPVAWGNEPAGSYSTGGAMPKMEQGDNVVFHKGLFRDTIPKFLSTVDKGRPLAYANVDCDLYGSTRDVLEAFHGRIIPGTVLVFDEYLCHPTWRNDEFRAWRECCKRFGWQYEYLAFSLSTKQAVVRVTS